MRSAAPPAGRLPPYGNMLRSWQTWPAPSPRSTPTWLPSRPATAAPALIREAALKNERCIAQAGNCGQLVESGPVVNGSNSSLALKLSTRFAATSRQVSKVVTCCRRGLFGRADCVPGYRCWCCAAGFGAAGCRAFLAFSSASCGCIGFAMISSCRECASLALVKVASPEARGLSSNPRLRADAQCPTPRQPLQPAVDAVRWRRNAGRVRLSSGRFDGPRLRPC